MAKDETIEVDRAEYEWLVWFMQHADFGPADGDVQRAMQADYEESTGRQVPRDWRYTDDDGEELSDD